MATGFCEPDQLFEPGGASGLQVYAGIEALHRGMEGGVDREFIAAGVYARLEIRGQAIVLDGIGDGCEVERDLFLKLLNVADVVYAFLPG